MREQRRYTHWQLESDSHDILWLSFNKSNTPINTLDVDTLQELDAILEVVSHHGVYRGLIISSAKKSGFIAGADIAQFTELQDPSQTFDLIRQGQLILQKIADLKIPTVALIHGFCLGGGLELALACQYRVALDDASTRLGLPEVTLGIHPGWGGLVRLPKLIGAPAALNLILSGKAVSAAEAAKIGIADFCVPKRHANTAATDIILQKVKVCRRSVFLSQLTNSTIVRPVIARLVKKQLGKKVNSQHYPAPFAALQCWQKNGVNSSQAFIAEARSVSQLVFTPSAQHLIRCFYLREQLKALTKVYDASRHVHVIGAGTMGGDIAAWCAFKGFTVTLQDRKPEFIAPAIKRAYEFYQKKLKDPRLIQEVMDRLIPDQEGRGMARANFIIEAVFEDLSVKQQVFKEIEAKADRNAILATNTSSIPLDEIAQVLQSPSRLVGIHFFNPVSKMQLIEIVCGEQTREDVIKSCFAFAGKIDRLPLPVKSRPGFLINRILTPYLLEAVHLMGEGVLPSVIDKAALDFGMPMGPVELADTIGLDVCLSVAKKLADNTGHVVPENLIAMVDAGHLGRKTGQGFYRYQKGGVKIGEKVKAGFGRKAEITDRLMLTLLNESVRCLKEGVVEDEDLLDGGMVFGVGFAPFRGGPIQYAYERGCQSIIANLRALQAQYGDRFKADPFWQSMARESQLEAVRPLTASGEKTVSDIS